MTLLSACIQTARKPDMIFDSGKLSDHQWELLDKACQFEAEKAVVPLRVRGGAGEEFRKIYVLCLEAKGVKFLGTADKLEKPLQ